MTPKLRIVVSTLAATCVASVVALAFSTIEIPIQARCTYDPLRNEGRMTWYWDGTAWEVIDPERAIRKRDLFFVRTPETIPYPSEDRIRSKFVSNLDNGYVFLDEKRQGTKAFVALNNGASYVIQGFFTHELDSHDSANLSEVLNMIDGFRHNISTCAN
jgi:hypothetical protein